MRTLVTDTETLHGISSGFVYNPFDNRLHAAGCRSIARMVATAESPKWHFPDRRAAEVELERHYARSHSGPWQLAACCLATVPRAHAKTFSRGDRAPASGVIGSTSDGPVVRRGADFVEVWADTSVSNESRAASSAGALRRLLLSELRRLETSPGRSLHAAYAGFRRAGKDIENLLFNDLDQTFSAFATLGHHGIRFEDLGPTAPLAPDGNQRASYYRYGLALPGDPFSAQLTEQVGDIAEVRVPVGAGRLSARILLAVLSHRPATAPASEWNGAYGLKVTVRGMSPGKDIKHIVDGCSAALQRSARTDRLVAAATRLALITAHDDGALIAALTTGAAPLGRARRLLTLDGAKNVRVTPDDDRCVAAEVRRVTPDGPPALAVQAWKAQLT